MAKTTCVITFDQNPNKAYFGGQTLQGRAVLTLHKPKTFRGIYIKIEGKANCKWIERHGHYRKIYYTGKECYLSEKTNVAGGSEGEITVGPGTFEYGFQSHLPVELPTSFEGAHGHIRYTVSLTLDRPHWRDQEFEEVFTVSRFLDLNVDPIYKMRQTNEKYGEFYPCYFFFCCPSDPLILTATLPYTGYTPGQQISVSVNVNNKSNQPVQYFEVKLTKHTTYHTHKESRKKKEEYDTVNNVHVPGMQAFSQKEFHSVLHVPMLPPTAFPSSNICIVKYKVHVEAIMNGFHENALVAIPITIGSVPIMDNPPPSRPNNQIPVTQPIRQHIGFSTGLNSSNQYNSMSPFAPIPMAMPMPMSMPMPTSVRSDVNYSSNIPPRPYEDDASSLYEHELLINEQSIYGNRWK